MKKQFKIIV